MGNAPDENDTSEAANEWRALFIAGSIGAGAFAAILNFTALFQDLPQSMNNIGIVGLIVSIVALSLSLSVAVDPSIGEGVVFLSFILSIIGVGASFLGIRNVNALTRNNCILAGMVGLVSFIVSYLSIQYE